MIARHIARRLLDPARLGRIDALMRDLNEIFTTHAWDGNVRELAHVVERAILQVPIEAAGTRATKRTAAPEILPRLSLRQANRANELESVRRAVAACGGNLGDAAKALGISRSTLYRRLNR